MRCSRQASRPSEPYYSVLLGVDPVTHEEQVLLMSAVLHNTTILVLLHLWERAPIIPDEVNVGVLLQELFQDFELVDSTDLDLDSQ